jgi:hypothetical protein
MPFFDVAYAQSDRPVRLCDVDPDLLGSAGRRHGVADRELDLIRLETGRWTDADRFEGLELGLLIIDGMLARRVGLGEQRRSELLGVGDLIRPWEREEPFGTLALQVEWEVMASARLAVLDAGFVHAAAATPEVLSALAVRSVRRSQRLAVQLAISDLRYIDHRLLAFFRHLGDRWGRMTANGMHLPIRMTHELIAELVGAKRPTVTTALGELERAGALVRLPDRTWLVRRPPDDPITVRGERGSPTWPTRRGGSS